MSAREITIQDAVAAVQRAFAAIPESEVALAPSRTLQGVAPNLAGHVEVASRSIPLAVTVKNQASTRAVTEVAHASGSPQSQPEPIRLLVAPYVGPRVAKAAREAGIAYVDLAGNAFVHHGSLHLSVEGREPPPAPDRHVSLFSPKASRIVRLLLYNPDRPMRQIDIADATGVSEGYVSQVVSELIDSALAERRDSAVQLLDPGEMLDLWCAEYQLRRISWQQWHVPVEELHDVAPRLSQLAREAKSRIAFTGLRAASLIAPYGFGGVTHVFASEAVADLLRELAVTPVATGGNLLVNAPPWDAGVFLGAEEVRSVLIAHPIQIYLDIWALGGRGREAAEVLREECIAF
ncbi:MAG: type IV toxin-antitoxin system AbiEi family antitoxin [Armatimonadota bacterium]|nr:type IV toxin-antitoxin system AbiEi family antitoxin [Armatimonadota bacterium]